MDQNETFIFGAGGAGEAVLHVLNEKNKKIKGFIDNNIEKKGKKLKGQEIIHSSEIKKYEKGEIVIATADFTEIYEIT